jgi:hypothetical protein
MATVVLNAYSKAYPFITNRIRASISLQSDPQALVATIIDTTAGHPARTWSFPGLPRNNYSFSLDEIDGSGNPVSNLALFAVVPGELDGSLTRPDEQIKVDTTPGLVGGTNSFVFDGSDGKPNYIGWEIVIHEISGRGIMVNGVDFSWNKDTAEFELLTSGDEFATDTWYNIHFNPEDTTVGNSYPTVFDFEIALVTSTISLDASYAGKTVLVEAATTNIVVTLPPIATVPQGRMIRIEIGKPDVEHTVKFIPNGSEVIDFLNGVIYAMGGESFNVYKYTHPTRGAEWRVINSDGNFKTVGLSVGHDFTSFRNAKLLNGASIDKNKYGRLYNEVVLQLPPEQVCNYDDWGTGDNKYLYSLANSSFPLNANKFRIPDRRGIFERNNLDGKAGDFELDMFAAHVHQVVPPNANSQGGFGKCTTGGDAPEGTGIAPFNTASAGGAETRPKNYKINKYVLL